MSYMHFTKDAVQLESADHLKLPDWSSFEQPDAYVIDDDGLVAAVNAALILGQPLLLTGEPGTGKTTLADRVAWQLNLGKPLRFETKSTSVAKDLFYTYDAVGRFQASRDHHGSGDNLDFITFQALGKAIILSGAQSSANESPETQEQPRRFHDQLLDRLEPIVDGQPLSSTGRARQPRRSLVLIDEIDKAHRDFPNDLLNEIDRMFFTIPELGHVRVAAHSQRRPIVLITSNSEKNLPDPFLRRCVYYHIEFPHHAALVQILKGRVKPLRDGMLTSNQGNSATTTMDAEHARASRGDELIQSCVRFFTEVRKDEMQLRKKPATSELIGWVRLLLAHGIKLEEPLTSAEHILDKTLSSLAKCQEDLELLRIRVGDLLQKSVQGLAPISNEGR